RAAGRWRPVPAYSWMRCRPLSRRPSASGRTRSWQRPSGRTAPAPLSRPSVDEAHRLAHVAHGLARHRAGPLGAHLDDPVHLLRVAEVGLGPLAPRLLLLLDRLDHRLLAVEAADARGGAALPRPILGGRVGVDEVELPH